MKQLNNASDSAKGRKDVACKKCNSTQIVANKRGYSFTTLFKVFFYAFIITTLMALLFPSLDNVSGVGNFNIIGTLLFYLGLPIAIIRGFIGRNDIVNGCMNCGNKWIAGSK